MIRNVKLEDAESINRIYNHYILNTTVSFETVALDVEEMRQRIKDIAAHHPYFVSEENGQLTGYCYAHPWKERAAYSHTWEVTIYLAPGETRHHTGTALLEHLVEACRKMECKALIACITEENQASIAFHGKMGFTKVSHFKQVGRKFGRWLDVVDMELLLE